MRNSMLLFLLLLAPSCATRHLNYTPPPQTFTRCMNTTLGNECLVSTDGLNWAPVAKVEVTR